MPIKPLFGVFKVSIDDRFATAKEAAGEASAAVTLEIHEEPLRAGSRRAEFAVLEPVGPVRITWNGIASLWACAQAAARICRLRQS